MDVIFYSLETQSIEDVLPGLLERALDRGWRAVVRLDSVERMNALDLHLWTWSDASFLAHGTAGAGYPSRQPVYLTTGEENPNRANVLFLAGVAPPPDWAKAFPEFGRVVVLFDGADAKNRDAASASCRKASAAGHSAQFWRRTVTGKWEQQKLAPVSS